MTNIRDIPRSETNPAVTALLEGQDAAGGVGSSFNVTPVNLEKAMVLSGAGAPASTPAFVGQRYIDTTNAAVYIATGTTSSGDWTELSVAFGTKAALEALLSDVNDLAEADGDTYSGIHNFSGATVNLPNDSVSNANLEDMLANRIKGRHSGNGDPQDLDADQVRGIINVEDGANNYSHPNHTGDVTSVGDGAQTIANDAVNNAKLANMAGDTIKGRETSTGDPADLTPAQVRSIINVEDGATGDQSAAEIEAIVNHDNLQGVDPDQHRDWTVDQGPADVHADNIPDGADATAIHDNVAGEIAGITLKTTPVSGDLLVIEDSAAANAKKRVTVGSLPGGGAPVDSVFGRTGAVVALVGDYSAFYVQPGAAEHNNFSDYSANQHVPAAAVAIFDGAGSDIPNNTTIDVISEWAGNLTVGRLRSKQSGSITVTVSRCPEGSYPGGFVALDTIVLSTAEEVNDLTVSGAILAGDTIRFATSGNTGVQHLMASVGMDKS